MPPDQDRQGASPPHILVVIPTRNRPTDLARCLESLTTVEYPSWELLIVDQSDDATTERLVGTYRERLPKLTYGRMRKRGSSRARNVGMLRAGRGIVAYLDDDCTIEAEWLAEVAHAFVRHPSATLIFGSVHAAPHDWREQFVPVVTFEEERSVVSSPERVGFGIGASMYMWPARSFHRHRFDIHLGPGTCWPAAEDRDYACRVLRFGETLVLTPAIRVCHHGTRSLKDGATRALLRGYAHADGAMDMKMIRCGDGASAVLALHRIRGTLTGVLSALVATGRPQGIGAMALYLRGLAESFLLPVDRGLYLYTVSRSAAKRRALVR